MRPESPISHLVRNDLLAFQGYQSAHATGLDGHIWLHANESAYPNLIDSAGTVRRYPHPQPPSLVQSLARLYGCQTDQLVIGRGSDECIDLLIRSVCTPNADAIIVTPPVFGMYAVAARMHKTAVVEVPLRDRNATFGVDAAAIVGAARAHATKLIFLCSPSNPTGATIASETIQWIAQQVEDRAVVVVDEAYIEFSDQPSSVALVAAQPNLVVLRTLSKAHALAGARIGCCIAHPDLSALLRCCQAPYPLPTPVCAMVEAALVPAVLHQTQERIRLIIAERARLFAALSAMACVRCVYRSDGNFLLALFYQAQCVFALLLAHGVVVRDQRHAPQLADALRITIGTHSQQTTLIAALETFAGGS